MSSRTRHVGAGVPLDRLPHFGPEALHAPTPAVLNVIRVALDRANMGTGKSSKRHYSDLEIWS